jgi:release factor glutamine methyltransferase
VSVGHTVSGAIRAAAIRLAATSDTARLDGEVLMAHALGVSRSDLLLRHMDAPEPAMFAALVDRRAAREPVAYIVGSQEFFGRPFRVTAATLIPRSDSESVVEAALAACPAPARLLDCGTGTGALLLTVLAECPTAAGVGIDRSAAALAVAQANADSLGLAGRAQLVAADWTQPGWSNDLGTFNLILANPPYVEADAALDPDVAQFEPAGALFAGLDGLDDYRVLIPQLPALLALGGLAVLEIGHTQAPAVAEIAAAAGFRSVVRPDLAGRPRAVLLRRSGD